MNETIEGQHGCWLMLISGYAVPNGIGELAYKEVVQALAVRASRASRTSRTAASSESRRRVLARLVVSVVTPEFLEIWRSLASDKETLGELLDGIAATVAQEYDAIVEELAMIL